MTVEDNAGSRTTYTWDTENRVTRVELPGGGLNTMTYDGEGKRRSYHDSAGLRNFLWDGENTARQTDAQDAINRRYTIEPAGYGELVSQDGLSFHHYDGLGSTDRITDASQGVVVSYLYRAFGQPTVPSGADPNRFGWVGRDGYCRQPDLGNYWLRALVYEDDNARFLSRDPAMADGNGYRYVNNNPVTLTDPAGLQACRTPSDPCWRHRRPGGSLGAAAMGGP